MRVTLFFCSDLVGLNRGLSGASHLDCARNRRTNEMFSTTGPTIECDSESRIMMMPKNDDFNTVAVVAEGTYTAAGA